MLLSSFNMAKPFQTLALLGSLRTLLFLFNVLFWVSYIKTWPKIVPVHHKTKDSVRRPDARDNSKYTEIWCVSVWLEAPS